MTNLNLDLIEKVKSGKAAIEHTQLKEDIDKLKLVLLNAFPTSELAYYPFGERYYGKTYKGSKEDDWDIYVMGEEQTLEIIPLASFFTNSLPSEDLSLIEQIDKRLKQAEDYLLNLNVAFYSTPLFAKIPEFIPCQHIVEPKEVSGQCGENSCIHKAEFNQQKEVWKPEVGSWVKDKQGNCGLVVEIVDKENIRVDNQSPHGGLITIGLEFILKPTPSEVEAHLVEISNAKGYKAGTTIRSGKGDFKHIIEEGANFHYTKGMLMHGSILIWCIEHGWATIVNEVEQERWKPEIGEKYFYIECNNYFEPFVENFIHSKYSANQARVKSGNCFKTEQEAQEKANKIKELLSKK